MISLAESETLMGRLMDYRFEDESGTGEDVAGHNLGNLILTALTKECGSFLEAVQIIGQFLNVKGTIVPATTQVISLFALMEDDVIVKGEANIPSVSNHIRKVFYDVPVKATPEAVKAISEADLIIYGIGSVYTSILPNVIIDEIREALQTAKAKRVYFCNAMTQPGETDGYSMEDHAAALIKHGAPVDEVVTYSDEIPSAAAERYAKQGSTPVKVRDAEHDYKLTYAELLQFDDGLIRHDSEKIKDAVESILEEL